jgi:PH (Pleckstrin Homology) domain-containing protein
MSKIFKQKSNKVLAFAFIGLIVVSQLIVFNMGYIIPLYFLLTLAILCAIIIWGMLGNNCKIEAEFLIINSGPFKNKIDINKIERLIKDSKPFIKRKNTAHQLLIVYNKNRRISIFPVEKEEIIEALLEINPRIKVE